jgi:hypothetical protein
LVHPGDLANLSNELKLHGSLKNVGKRHDSCKKSDYVVNKSRLKRTDSCASGKRKLSPAMAVSVNALKPKWSSNKHVDEFKDHDGPKSQLGVESKGSQRSKGLDLSIEGKIPNETKKDRSRSSQTSVTFLY